MESVSTLTLEERPRALNLRDHHTIDMLRIKNVIPPTLRIEHQNPLTEQMLWIPDQLLGALEETLGGQHRWFEKLEARVRIVHITI